LDRGEKHKTQEREAARRDNKKDGWRETGRGSGRKSREAIRRWEGLSREGTKREDGGRGGAKSAKKRLIKGRWGFKKRGAGRPENEREKG